MARTSRLWLRIYFILVIALGLFGGWYATQNWQIEPTSLTSVGIAENTDWVDFLATLGEETIQLLLGFTSSE